MSEGKQQFDVDPNMQLIIDSLKDSGKYKEIYADPEIQKLKQAYDILGTLADNVWRNPNTVPTPIALSLLHSRDYIGRQIADLLKGEDEDSTTDEQKTE
ncbi:MAG: hypothetical protein AAB410_00065 [Patescibacteria group bacterium]